MRFSCNKINSGEIIFPNYWKKVFIFTILSGSFPDCIRIYSGYSRRFLTYKYTVVQFSDTNSQTIRTYDLVLVVKDCVESTTVFGRAESIERNGTTK